MRAFLSGLDSVDVPESPSAIRPVSGLSAAAADLELRLRDLEAGLRAGAIHRHVLEAHLQAPLAEPEAIQIRWMLLGLDIIEKHRCRLIQQLEARRTDP